MAVDEYLRAHFDGADRDFVEGEVFERNTGEAEHSIVQGELIRRLFAASAAAGLEVRPEIRLQTLPNQRDQFTTTLNVSIFWFYLAIPVGAVLMALVIIGRRFGLVEAAGRDLPIEDL